MAAVTDTPAPPKALARVSIGVWLGLLVLASIALRLVVNTRFRAPTILTDELTYATLARQIVDDGVAQITGYGIYPLLLAPSWVLFDFGTDAYTAMKATNAVLVSLTAIPVFLLARRMMRDRFALLAAALTLLMPSMAFSGHIMTENALVLFFAIAVWRIVVAIERPTVLNQTLMLAAIIAAYLAKAQAAVLVIAVPIAILLAIAGEERAAEHRSFAGFARRLVRFWPLALVAGIGAAAIALRTVLTSWRWNDLLQAYSITADGQYTASKVARYFVWHLGEATFALGVIPVAALVALVGMAVLNRARSSAERAFLATAVVVLPLVILQVATFMSYWAERVSERNMFCVFPIALIALALWFDRGLPRPRRTAAIAAAIAGGLVLCVPFAFLYQRSPTTETWAVVVPDILTRKLPGGVDDVQILIVAGVAVALFLFGIARGRLIAPLIAAVLIGYFAIGATAAVHKVTKVSKDFRAIPGLGEDASWIDRNLPEGADAVMLLGGSLGPQNEQVLLWEVTFFNRHPLPKATWGPDLTVDPANGAVARTDGSPLTLPEYVITPSSFRLAGEVVADRGAFVMVRPSQPYRLDRQSAGFYADGWIAPAASLTDYAHPDAPSTLTVRLTRADAPVGVPDATVTVRVGSLVTGPDGVQSIGEETGAFSAPLTRTQDAVAELVVPPGPFLVQITTDPGFKPSDLGSPDTRDMGARAELILNGQPLSG